MNVSAVLITLNEARNIEAAIESVSWADEIIVVDAYSTDSTPDICRRLNVKFLQREWDGYVNQKNFALAQAARSWVLSIDADECVSPLLKSEITGLAENGPRGYRIPRKTFFLNQWIEHTSWSPDYQLRLFKKEHAQWRGGSLHESVKVDGVVETLRHPLLHYSYASISDFLQRLDRYSNLAAQDCLERGARAGYCQLLLHPAGAFIRSYVLKRGFQDGVAGLSVSLLASVSVFFRYLKLLELQRKMNEGPDPRQ